MPRRRSSTPPRRSTPSCRHSRMRSQAMRSRKPKCPKPLLLFPTEMPEPPYAEALRELTAIAQRSEEHTSELQSLRHLVCRLLLEKKKKKKPREKIDCRQAIRSYNSASASDPGTQGGGAPLCTVYRW